MKLTKKDYLFITLGIIIIVLLVLILFNTYKAKPNYVLEDEIVEKNDNSEKGKNEEKLPEIKENTYIDVENKEKNRQEDITNNSNNKTNEISNLDKSAPVYSNNDKIVINELENTLNELENAQADETFLTNAKATFIDLVDFVFYDGKIKGVTFKQLTDKGKEKVLALINKIDNSIDNLMPGYKESMGEKTSAILNKASSLIKSGIDEFDELLMNNLDSDDYNNLINTKNKLLDSSKKVLGSIKQGGSDLFENTKENLNDWYQDWKTK